MDKRYQVVFLGLLKTEDHFMAGMSRLGASSVIVEHIIKKAPIVLKADMTLGHARRYADAVQQAGGRVNIRAHGFFEENNEKDRHSNIKPLENFTMCPQCGYKQLKTKTN